MSDRDDDENEGWQTVGALRAAADAALRAAADAEAEAGDEARREATRLRAENTRLRDALDGIVEDLSVPSRPAPWVSHALKLAQDALAQKRTQETG